MNDEIYRLAERVISIAREYDLSISTAESCTGGGIGAALTAISGASKIYRGGIVSYSNDVKINLLNVPRDVIEKHGAVSQQTAKAMADGALNILSTDLAISVTGIAGPTGGSIDKPVGTVWIGLAQKGHATKAICFSFTDEGRESIRINATIQSLKTLYETLQSH